MRPRIGITTSFHDVEYGAGEQRLRHEYVVAIEAAGGLPIITPMIAADEQISELSTVLDGLVMTGGPAVTAGLVGDLPSDLSRNFDIRLQSDLVLLKRMFETDKPFLGICYGMQQLNALAGGTIYADIENADPFHNQHLREAQLPHDILPPDVTCSRSITTHSQKRGASVHAIHIARDSHLYAMLQQDQIEVNTRHIQAIAEVGEGLRVSAVAPDGVIEAIEDESGQRIGVQFHPERSLSKFRPIFSHLVNRARSRQTVSAPAAI